MSLLEKYLCLCSSNFNLKLLRTWSTDVLWVMLVSRPCSVFLEFVMAGNQSSRKEVFVYGVTWPCFGNWSMWCFCRSSLWLMMLNLLPQSMYPRIVPISMLFAEVLCHLCFWTVALPHYPHEAHLGLPVSRGKRQALLLYSLLWNQSENQNANSFLRFDSISICSS